MDHLSIWLLVLAVVVLFSLGMMAYHTVKEQNNKKR
ncbi:hypothetical protein JOC54_000304 [Alkalihalobacillus xiaoxiensis]|uniref:DUF3149 domain-containing protein n=1 Tax=Shouchella xiaoxiensis TaxID=766895 RepID=A0ABS2SNI1_9BACI|nr:hypothetical protein [Shouchella xiaoxiensis]